MEVPIPIEHLARRAEVRALGVPTITLPIRGPLDEPHVDWAAMRGEGADILGKIRGRLGDEAPKTAAAIGALEGLAGGNVDEVVALAAELLRQIGDARQDTKTTTNAEPNNGDILPDTIPGSLDQKPDQVESDRPILEAFLKLLRDETIQ